MTREREIYIGTQQFVAEYLEGLYDAETLAKKCALWADEHPESPWTSVKDRLPERNTSLDDDVSVCVLVLQEGGAVIHAYYDFDESEWRECSTNFRLYPPTHWMPIPRL